MTVRNDETGGNTGTGEPIMSGGTTGGAAAGGDRALGSRAPAFIRRSRPLLLAWRAAVFLAGLAVVVLGVVMLPLPGPGWVVVFLGMGLWATEFGWARLVLRRTRRTVRKAARSALDPKVRGRNLTLTALALAALVGAGGWYLARYGLALPWTADES